MERAPDIVNARFSGARRSPADAAGQALGLGGLRVTARALSPWAGYAAAAVLLAFGLASFYVALGGTTGLSTLGGVIEEKALARDPTLIAATWITGVLKILAAALALALVQPWGQGLPRRPVLLVAWGAAALLTIYGVLQETGVAFIALGVVTPDEPVSTKVLLWRGLLWEPLFIVCGVLLGLAARHGHRRPVVDRGLRQPARPAG